MCMNKTLNSLENYHTSRKLIPGRARVAMTKTNNSMKRAYSPLQ